MTVLFFARARDLAGCDSLEIDLPPGSRLADVRHHLAARFPNLASLLTHSALALNGSIVEETTIVPMDAEVALLPPVSGG